MSAVTVQGPRVMTMEQTQGIQRFMAERALRWIIARGPADWVAAVRPRTVNADAFATEQDAWKRWHEGHTASEMEFRVRQSPVTV